MRRRIYQWIHHQNLLNHENWHFDVRKKFIDQESAVLLVISLICHHE